MNPHLPATCRALVVLTALLAPLPIQAASPQATDDAFAALFSIAGPEKGNWDFAVPDDFEPGSEAGLIAYLTKKQKAGADFDAYRHFGTLLHHAIRGGKVKTALWLLDHGADPRKTLRNGRDDAMTLAVSYKRTKLVEILQTKYGLTSSAQPPDAPAAQAAPSAADIARMSLDYTSARDLALARELLAESSWTSPPSGDRAKDAKAASAKLARWVAFKAKMPPAAFAKVVDDERAMSSLIRLYARLPRELDIELDALPPGLLQRHAKAAIETLANESRLDVSEGKDPRATYSLPAESWRALWRHLDKPIDYTPFAGLAGRLPPELWPELFASGYADRRAESALECAVARLPAKNFEELWPRLTSHFPDIREAAPRMVLAHYRMVSNEGACYSWTPDETRKKLVFLASKGISEPVRGLVKRELEYESSELLAAIKPFRPKGSPKGNPRLVEAKPNCSFTLTDALYRALLEAPTVPAADDPASRTAIETVQLVEIPGAATCGMLVGGTTQINGYVGGPADSFTGPETNPVPSCVDPTDHYEIWRDAAGKVERLRTDMGQDDGEPTLILVQDTTNGQRRYLHTGEQYGRCHGRLRLPFVFEWQQTADGFAMMKSRSTELQNALFEQCSADDGSIRCAGIPSMNAEHRTPASQPGPTGDTFKGVSLPAFIRTFRSARHRDYQAAILALDKPALKTLQAEGIPGDWTAEAIQRIGASGLPLAEKRKRTAWIFYDRRQLARAIGAGASTAGGNVLDNLLAWLPREDWSPVLEVAPAVLGDSSLAWLRDKAAERNLPKLACDIDHARGLICGETWSAGE